MDAYSSLTNMRLSEILSAHMFDMFHATLTSPQRDIILSDPSGAVAIDFYKAKTQPCMIPPELIDECFPIILQLVAAFQNPVVLPYHIPYFVDQLPATFNAEKEEALKHSGHWKPLNYSNPDETITLDANCIIVDSGGIIIAWILPQLLNGERQCSLIDCASILRSHLNKNINRTSSTQSWRKRPEYFSTAKTMGIGAGAMDFSPAWFPAGHGDAWKRPEEPDRPLENLATSPILREKEGIEWLDRMGHTHALLCGILRIIHPDQFTSGMRCIKTIGSQAKFKDVVPRWGNVFNATSIISNRITPRHRDVETRTEYFDILTSAGIFEPTVMEFNNLGIQATLRSGSLFAICGKILCHAVPRVQGERICNAWYMRSNVQASQEIAPASWMTQARYSHVNTEETSHNM